MRHEHRHLSKIGHRQLPKLPYDYDRALNMHVLGPGSLAINEWQKKGLPLPEMNKIQEYRINRIREQLHKHDLMGILLYDPLHVRYSTDSTNMQLWTAHNTARYCFITADGPAIIFDYHDCEHLSSHNPFIDEIRTAKPWFYFSSGCETERFSKRWSLEIIDLVNQYGAGNRRLAVDKLNPEGTHLLEAAGIELHNGEQIMELARVIKSEEEIKAMRCAIDACENSMRIMYDQMSSGMSENHLWSILHAENIKRGGEWIETRILACGPRTNPWFQESSSRPIQKGEMLSFDTDLIGSYGICVDISRSWLVDRTTPTQEQQDLYDRALEQINKNTEILQPGMSFKEYSHKAHTICPNTFRRYGLLVHGVGLCDEYPSITFPDLWEEHGYDGTIESGMVLCVESYIGRKSGGEGVKLEEQILITDNGYEKLSNFPIGLNPDF